MNFQQSTCVVRLVFGTVFLCLLKISLASATPVGTPRATPSVGTPAATPVAARLSRRPAVLRIHGLLRGGQPLSFSPESFQ